MLLSFKNGQTSVILRGKLLDSSSTTGAGLTGLTSASAGLIISTIADNEATATAYTVAGSTIETIATLGTYSAPTATKCRFKEVDSTNHPGVYEIQLADARLGVSNAKSLLVSITGATNLVQADFVVQLQSDDPYIAKPANYASLSIDGNGRVDVIKVAGTTQTAGDIIGRLGTPAGASVSADIATVATYVDTEVAAIKAKTDQLTFTTANQVDATVVTNNDKTGYALTSGERNSVADALLDRDMSLGADNGSTTVRTVRQALRALRNKWAIVSGTATIYKEDDTTASWTSTVTTTADTSPVTSSDPAG